MPAPPPGHPAVARPITSRKSARDHIQTYRPRILDGDLSLVGVYNAASFGGPNMRFRLPELCLGTLVSAAIVGSAAANPALDPASAPASDPTIFKTEPAGTPVDYGVGIRLRNVRVPKSILELFVERAAGGASNVGYGVELTRRRGTVELQIGLEFDRITLEEGVWIEKGKPVPTNQADYVLSSKHAPGEEQLGWFTIDFTFVNHAVINKHLAFRYGGGLGLGIITGSLWHYNVNCHQFSSNAAPEPGCRPDVFADGKPALGQADGAPEKYELPPVFPVVNAIVGLQIKPADKLVINVEGGIRTLPFFGATVGYFF